MITQIEIKLETETAIPNTSTLQSTVHSTSPPPQNQDPADKTPLILEKILDRKIENNNKFYLIKWKNAIDSEPIWEPIESLVTCVEAVIDYEVQRRLKNPDFYYEKTCASVGDLVSNEKRKAEFELTDKKVTRKQVKTKKGVSPRHWINKRCKLVKNSGLLSDTQWEDKSALDEISKKVRMSKPFTINPIKFRFRDIMRVENDSEKTSEYTPQKVRDRVRRFDTEIAGESSGSTQKRRPGRPRKIKLEHEEVKQIEESDDESSKGSETLRRLIVEIEDSDGEDPEEEEEEEQKETDEEYKAAEEEEGDGDIVRRSRGRPRKIKGRRGRPRKMLTEEEQTEEEKPKPKKSRGRPRKARLGEGQASNSIELDRKEKRGEDGQGDNENKENRKVDVEKPDREIRLDLLELLTWSDRENSGVPRKRRRPRNIFKIIKENAQQKKQKNGSDDEIESLEDFETLVSQLRESMELDKRYEEPRRKRGKPRKDLLGIGRQEAQLIEEVKQEEDAHFQRMIQSLNDKVFGKDGQTHDDLANVNEDPQDAKLMNEVQEKEDAIVQGSGNENKDVEVNKAVSEAKSVGKETLESKLKEGKTSAVSILDQMQEDLMNLESPVDERAFDDGDY